MNKPKFLWWAHKALWNALAKNPKASVSETHLALIEAHSGAFSEMPVAGCFACDSRDALQTMFPEKDIVCEKYCPLDWRANAYAPNDCARAENDIEEEFYEAQKTGDYERAAKCAARIRDLPLAANAREVYDVEEEVPNDGRV